MKIKFPVLCLLAVIITSMLISCGNNDENDVVTEKDEEQIEITVGSWPSQELNPTEYEVYETYKKAFEEKYPEIKIKESEWEYTSDAYLPLAASGMLPTIYSVPYTESAKIINSGYARDVTDICKEYNVDKGMNEFALSVAEKDGAFYGVPYFGYVMGMTYNAKLFIDAGLVDEEGRPTYPKTWEQVASMGQIIKEKTGAYGFSFDTKNGKDAFQFLALANAYGVEFEKKDKNDKWNVAFNSPEMIEAVQFLSDLKWKYDIIPSDFSLDTDELFGTGQLAMREGIGAGSTPELQSYGISKDNIGCGPVPSGPYGRFPQYGGEVYMFSLNSTNAEIEAAFKWLDFIGDIVNAPENYEENLRFDLQSKLDKGYGIDKEYFILRSEGEKNEIKTRVYEEMKNVNSLYATSLITDGVKMTLEPPVCTYQLYEAISGLIQTVLNDSNADIPSLIKDCAENFQQDYLDNAE